MARNADVTLDWADGTHKFRLGIGELCELQEKCDAGPAFIMARLANGTWKVNDIVETIRIGLIGGGMKDTAALALTKRYAKPPLADHVQVAFAVVAASVVGVEDEPLGKTGVAAGTASLSQEANSDSPPSTPAAP